MEAANPYSPVICATLDSVFVSRPQQQEIVQAEYDGRVVQRWHSRTKQFQIPRGLVLTRKHVFVADVGANRIFRIDRLNQNMDVVAGNGKAERPKEFLWRTPKACPLAQPMGLVREGGTLLIALAGVRQIWALELEYNALGRAAGTGNGGFVDGPFLHANFERPTDLVAAWKGERIYILDAGKLRCLDFPVKAIRTVPLPVSAHIAAIAADRERMLYTVEKGAREVQVWDTHSEHPVGRFALPWTLETVSMHWYGGELWALAEGGELMARKHADSDVFEAVTFSD